MGCDTQIPDRTDDVKETVGTRANRRPGPPRRHGPSNPEQDPVDRSAPGPVVGDRAPIADDPRERTVNPLAAAVIVLVAAVALVLFTMIVENWAHLVEPLRKVVDVPPAPRNSFRTTPNAAPTPPVARVTPVLATSPAAAHSGDRGSPVRAITANGPNLHLRDASVADVTSAVLFAAYSAGTYSAAGRVGAWITVAETPPSADPVRFAPGVNLRDKPAKVAELLSFDDEGRAWVGLNPAVDIRRGLSRYPVSKGTLSGLVIWWERTRSLPAQIEAASVGRLRQALSVIGSDLDGTPWERPIAALVAAVTAADDADVAVSITVGESSGAPGPVAAGTRDAFSTPRAGRSANGTSRPGQDAARRPVAQVRGSTDPTSAAGSTKRPSDPQGKSTTAVTASRGSGA